MPFLSISAKKVWLFVGLTTVFAVLGTALFFWAFGALFGRSPVREFELLKRNVDPRQVQSWAVEMLEQFPIATNGVFAASAAPHAGRLMLSNAPAFLNRLPAFGAVGPEIVISGADNAAKRHVELVYFYGGWGNGQTILAGSPAFAVPTNSRCFCWAPGVYYRVW